MNLDNRKQLWEEQLRQGLHHLSKMPGEQPPDLAQLQMLVASVQAEQRQRTLRDLARFWAVALALLAGILYATVRRPEYFLPLQGAVALLLVVGAALWDRHSKKVTE